MIKRRDAIGGILGADGVKSERGRAGSGVEAPNRVARECVVPLAVLSAPVVLASSA